MVRIKFSDGNILSESFKSISEEEVFEELHSRKGWYKISDGARSTYINPSAIVNIEITNMRKTLKLLRQWDHFYNHQSSHIQSV